MPNTFLGYHIKRQLIRSSTSTAANYRAACVAQSKPTFISKMGIVIEEADESLFWLEFISDEHLLDNYEQIELVRLIMEANELVSIFAASRITATRKRYS